MSRLNLTRRERHALQRQLAKTLDARILRRTLAVTEFDQGRSVQEIAKMLGVTRQSIYNWVQTYRQSRDPHALNDQPGRGRPQSLEEEEEHLLETFFAASPQDFGYPHANWTRVLLADLLEDMTGNRFSLDTLRRAIRRLDYVWKRPRYDLLPDPDQEKKTSNSPPNPGFARAERGVGSGRDRPVAVSSATCRVVPARRGRPRLVERSQCPAGDFRSDEPQNGIAVVLASERGTKPRFPSLFGSRSLPLPGMACGVALG